MSIYDKQCIFQALFYLTEVRFYTGNVRVFVKNSMCAVTEKFKMSKSSKMDQKGFASTKNSSAYATTLFHTVSR